MALGPGRILADEMGRVLADGRFDRLDRAVQRRLAPAHQALVGADADEQPVAPVDPVLERVDAGDFHLPDGRRAFPANNETFQKCYDTRVAAWVQPAGRRAPDPSR